MLRGDTVLRFFESDTCVKLGSFKQMLKSGLLVCPMLLGCKQASKQPEMICLVWADLPTTVPHVLQLLVF